MLSLSLVGRDALLPALYGQVIIPPVVYAELRAGGEWQDRSWLIVRHLASTDVVRVLRLLLDAGEAEVIALGFEMGGTAILIDERKARSVASQLDLSLKGTLDVVLLAKQRGLIPSARAMMDDLINISRFRIAKRLYARILADAHETAR